jgi:hypothetical protein
MTHDTQTNTVAALLESPVQVTWREHTKKAICRSAICTVYMYMDYGLPTQSTEHSRLERRATVVRAGIADPHRGPGGEARPFSGWGAGAGTAVSWPTWDVAAGGVSTGSTSGAREPGGTKERCPWSAHGVWFFFF